MSKTYSETEMINLVDLWSKECVSTILTKRSFPEWLKEVNCKNAKYWKVSHSPDLTETGNPMRRTYIKTVWVGMPGHQHYEQEMLEGFCIARFGPKVAFVQGVAPTPAWHIYSIDHKTYAQAMPILWANQPTETHQVIIYLGEQDNLIRIVNDRRLI